MASVKKFTKHAVINQLRHNERTIKNPSNEDIDSSQSHRNYSLNSPRSISDYQYFKNRMDELYCYNRNDVKVLAGWVITAPQDLDKKDYRLFFKACDHFLKKRYGEKNCIQSIVHADESGQPHLHFLFIPVVPDEKHGGEKVCANNVLNRKELRNFHPALQKFLSENNINVNIMTGITKQQGGNKTVSELKRERDFEFAHKRDYEYSSNKESRW